MTAQPIDAEFREQPGSALATVEHTPPPPALFGTTDPVEVVRNAVRVADALKDVLVKKKLISNISGKEYPVVEAWLTLAAMLRLTTICEWTRQVEDGWEARVYVRDANGNTVGAAEAQCLRSERSKRQWEDYAIRSMAQTRATSKSLRSVLGFIMSLAGYEATPAEEMPAPEPAPKAPLQPTPTDLLAKRAIALGVIETGDPRQAIIALRNYAKAHELEFRVPVLNAHFDELEASRREEKPATKPAALITDAQRRKIMALCNELMLDDEGRHGVTRRMFGKEGTSALTRDEAARMIDELSRTAYPQGAPT